MGLPVSELFDLSHVFPSALSCCRTGTLTVTSLRRGGDVYSFPDHAGTIYLSPTALLYRLAGPLGRQDDHLPPPGSEVSLPYIDYLKAPLCFSRPQQHPVRKTKDLCFRRLVWPEVRPGSLLLPGRVRHRHECLAAESRSRGS